MVTRCYSWLLVTIEYYFLSKEWLLGWLLVVTRMFLN